LICGTRVAGFDITIRAAEFAPSLVCQIGAASKLLPGITVTLLADDVIERLQSLHVLGVKPDLTGSLASALMARAWPGTNQRA